MNSFKRNLISCASAAVLTGLSSAALADNGALDFLDPCAKVRTSFNHEQAKVRGQFDVAKVQVSNAEAPRAYVALWTEVVKKAARPKFDSEIAPIMRQHGIVNSHVVDAGFKKWFDQQLAVAGDPTVKKLVNDNYRKELNGELEAARAKTETNLAAAKREVDYSCKMDVSNQVLRVTLSTVLAPIGIVGGNFEGAKREPGLIAKGIRVFGPSIKDIETYGPLGGPNSVLRKPFG